MMKKKRNLTAKEKASWSLFIVSFIIYSIIAMTKSAYAASIASIVGEGLFTKSAAGTINAGFYLCYGAAQLLGIKVVDRISPTKLVTMTLIGTLISLIGMAFSKNFYMMLILWSFCGLIQFAIWPAILRIIEEYLLHKQQHRARIYISFAFCVGMLLNYLIASIVLGITHWSRLFIVFAITIVVCMILWAFTVIKTKPHIKEIVKENKERNERHLLSKSEKSEVESDIKFGKLILISGVALLLIPAFIRTALDSGLKSWVPTMITENYSVSASFATFLTTALVCINLLGIFIAGWMYPSRTRNVAWAYGLCFLIAVPFTLALFLTGKINVLLIALFLSVVTTLMYAGHQLINVIIPSSFTKFNKAGSVASLINSIASFGAVFANLAFGYLAENFGWNATILSWLILLVISFAFCALSTPIWKKFRKKYL